MELPTGPQMIAAVRIWGNLCSDDHPLLVLARDLTQQYNYRVTAKDPMTLHRISQQRHAMIREADAWVHHTVCMDHTARLHTETIGAIIDRLAYRSVLIDTDPRSHHPCQLEHLWNSLYELAIGYEHLSEDLLSGARRLPGPSPQPGAFTPGT